MKQLLLYALLSVVVGSCVSGETSRRTSPAMVESVAVIEPAPPVPAPTQQAQETDMPEAESQVPDPSLPHPLSEGALGILQAHDWNNRVGAEAGVWISVATQTFRIVQDRQILWEVACATAEKGTGFQMDSFQTPLGWHAIVGKTGDDALWGQVFRGGVPQRMVWKPGDETSEDLVLTRILFLGGLEPGKNQGGNVDSRKRCIYVHGTNDEARIGEPSSHGCIRLRNDDVIEAYGRIPNGTKVLLTQD